MKVCPVCEMEEDDSALTCSMCGSDFEPTVKEAPLQDSPADTPNDISSDIAEMNLDDVKNTEPDSEETSELSEEEKLLEETLSATETESSEEKSEIASSELRERMFELWKEMMIETNFTQKQKVILPIYSYLLISKLM